MGSLSSLFRYSGKSEMNSLILLLDEGYTGVSGENLKKFLDHDSAIASQTIINPDYKRLQPHRPAQ
jgi:hypothetical protein